ncbi:MAG: hypothetical protein GY814_11555 [Gammaproteobacteria bacterium]|nr:hypothetical protein [Gammaproteobacteria bacterium]
MPRWIIIITTVTIGDLVKDIAAYQYSTTDQPPVYLSAGLCLAIGVVSGYLLEGINPIQVEGFQFAAVEF